MKYRTPTIADLIDGPIDCEVDSVSGWVRLPNHCDLLTFDEQIDLDHQMQLITKIMDPPQSRAMSRDEWQNVQRMAETLKRYRETNDPKAVNDSLCARVRVNGIDYVSS